MHTFHFDDQYHTHFSYGYSIAPGGQEIVGDQEAFVNKKGKALCPRQILVAPGCRQSACSHIK